MELLTDIQVKRILELEEAPQEHSFTWNEVIKLLKVQGQLSQQKLALRLINEHREALKKLVPSLDKMF